MLIRLLLSLTFIFSSALVHATPQQLLENIHSMRLASTNAITNYHMFSGLDADSKYELLIAQSIEAFDTALESAQSLASNNDMTDEIDSVKKNWAEFKELMEINRSDITDKGFPELARVDDMSRTNNTIVSQLTDAYAQLQEKSGITVNKQVQQARLLALLMEEMTQEYAIRATTNVGHVYAGLGESKLVEMADTFQVKFDELTKTASSPKTDALLGNIQSKWQFIEKRIRNFNENTVVFLVVSYNDRIVGHLKELEELL